jgi:5-methylthioadenosine/S-adenosylhomocysteine deaminase
MMLELEIRWLMHFTFSLLFVFLASFELMASERQQVDLIVEGDYLVTMNQTSQVLEDAAVAVRDGEIIASDTRTVIHDRFTADKVISGKDRILMPGLVNGHSHMAMTLLRGLADDLDLMTWLNEFIFPAEVGFVDKGFVRTGTDLACWEMLLGGTTTVVDMYYFPDVVAESLEQCGMRGIVAATVIGQESPDAKTPELGLEQAKAFIKRWQGRHNRIMPALGPHAIYTTPPEMLLKVKAVALELDVPISMHIAESESEIEFSSSQYEHSTIELLSNIGFLDPDVTLIGAHVVWPTSNEVKLLAQFKVGAVHNPTSNMKITAGVAPVPVLQKAGVMVGLGTDGAASNNDLDMWEEMRIATLLQKITLLDPTVLPARKVLRMATIEGAYAIGLGDKTGSIEVGKRADLIQVQITAPHMQPLYDVESHLVYVADSQDVVTVLVDGEVRVENGAIMSIDTEMLRQRIKIYQQNIQKSILDISEAE